MGRFVEHIPLVLFGLAYFYKGILFATLVLVLSSIVVIPIIWKQTGKAPKVQIFTALLVSIMGGLTLFSGNTDFIKMKPTVASLLFALILFAGNMLNKMPLKILMSNVLTMEDLYWKKISFRFAIYFLLMGLLNEYIWRTQSEFIWIQFKIFGLFVGYIIFMILQIPFLKKHGKFIKS